MTKSEEWPQQSIPALRNFSAGLILLAEIGPDRMTVTQASFFLTAALADSAGRPATFSEIRETLGHVVNKSLHSTYRIFVDEGRSRDGKRESGLGWLTRETDSADNRRKYLRLTNRGKQIMAEIAAALSLV